ncbi:hypothetical protein OOK36_49380 [Streptomyces sp. NBC_00365]|uniref:hypothetical protein n=1 Tax=Streptomyces sp. NBC_00365 TaxID=2975726 RepID=UPI0022577AF9|nr:hypothetical protein [Streptomyces sp. NBC_00365]MCX5096597.1 hypothetical protein [Streptomyces sp. NBC_00365]
MRGPRGQWFARRFGRAPHTVVNRMDGGYVENLIQTGAIHGGVHFHVHRPEGPRSSGRCGSWRWCSWPSPLPR